MENETEEQQIAALKKWWSENGSSIIVGIVLGLAGLFGIKAWMGYQDSLSERASTIYSDDGDIARGCGLDMMYIREISCNLLC